MGNKNNKGTSEKLLWLATHEATEKKTSLPFRMMAGKRRVTSGAAERHQSFSLSLLMSELGI